MAYSDTDTHTPEAKYPETARHTDTSNTASEQMEDVKQTARESAGQIKQDFQHLTAETRERGRELLEQQRRSAAGGLGGMAEALRETAQHLNQEDQPTSAHYVTRAADSLDRLAGMLQTQDFRSMFQQVETYARQRPAVFIGGSVLAGFLLVRFLKSSAKSQGSQTGTWPRGTSERSKAESEYVF